MSVASVLAVVALALLFLVVPRVFRRQRRPARAHVTLQDGVLVMRTPRRYAILLGASALVPAALLGAIAWRAATGGAQDASRWGVAATIVAALAAVGVAAHQIAAAFRSGFVVDEFGVSRIGVLRRRRVRWGEVARVAFNPVNRWFFITTAGGAHLWVPVDTHGIGDFAAVALVRLPPAALAADEDARDALEELATAGRPTAR
ncbi:MAG TPA: PH domain-containing protein [Anaeromyxobacter sp.]|nr:PH domain-containing protein [Anaeromyxobacter sp.]